MALATYKKKRDFGRTPEPKGKISKANRRRFVAQEHHASKLHFDFRLEMGGVLKSWAVPRGPSLDPSEKRLAVPTEDHPVEYLKFEGIIPAGKYGAGRHMIWDAGTYELTGGNNPLKQYDEGKLKFRLHGDKLRGEFSLVRMAESRGDQWLLIKGRDEYAEPGWKLELRLSDDEQGKAFRKKENGSARKRVVKRAVRKDREDDKKSGGKAIPASRAFKEKKLSGDLNVKIGRETVSLTNLDKVYWPEEGLTKGDLIKYYYEVSKYILPYLKDRPLILKRYPSGIKGPFFHQHDVDEAPDFARIIALEVEDRGGGHTVNYMVGGNLATLLYAANLGAIECHPWHSRAKNLDRPDWIVFDLDPGEGVHFETICEAALCVRDILNSSGLSSYAKTSGSRGIHVYVPLKPAYSYEQAVKFAEQVAERVAREMPEAATVERSLKKRKRGQIYVDHMQNARGKSVAAPYSVRPKPGATVSAPLDWSEVKRKKIKPQDFTIKNMLRRIERKGDIFKEVLTNRQTLPDAPE
jgi:DNA ligase D-like protein (predicted polymerase)/DNA ligase D-like protein (predicted 3'-phosphoesterase)